MTEREKRLLGLPHYLFKEPEILEEITKTKDLCYEYNQVRPSDSVAQNEILEKIFQKRYENIKIWSPFQCFHGKNIKIGQNFFANHNFFAPCCVHRYNIARTHASSLPVASPACCWICLTVPTVLSIRAPA